MITTEAWVLYSGRDAKAGERPEPGELQLEAYSFPEITEFEVLVEPLYGCWEGNMSHAVERRPVDICRQRGEDKVVIGNTGVVRVLKTGPAVTLVKEGQYCVVFPNAVWDAFGYTIKAYAYDAPHTIGIMAKQTKMHERQLIPIPEHSRNSLRQWATTGRYITAWANWNVAYTCWRTQMTEEEYPHPYVWGWGGGVTLAVLKLATLWGGQPSMLTSSDERMALLQRQGIEPIDRRQFADLAFDEERYSADPDYRRRYQEAEKCFLETVRQRTHGQGVSIFIDNIGTPVFRATLRALARQGVVATSGWKHGLQLSVNRAIECISRHIHVHTHFARYSEGCAAVRFAEEHAWLPPEDEAIYSWERIPQLIDDYEQGAITSYFPLYQVNAL